MTNENVTSKTEKYLFLILKFFQVVFIFTYFFFISVLFYRYFLILDISRTNNSIALIKSLVLSIFIFFLGYYLLKVFSFSKKLKITLLIFISMYIFFAVILNLHFSIYRLHAHISDLFSSGIVASLIVIKESFTPLIFLLAFSFFAANFLVVCWVSRIKTNNVLNKKIIICIFLISFLGVFYLSEYKYIFNLNYYFGSITKEYNSFYDDALKFRNNKEYKILSNGKDRIFVIQLESLGNFLVKSETTPNLFNLKEEGYFLENIQSASTSTIRNLETLFCGVPPSFGKTLSLRPEKLSELKCLPQILKKNGYKTVFLKHGDLNLTNTDEFINSIGFDEFHKSNIFKDNDMSMQWGYPSNIAFERYYEKINQYSDEKLFVYMEFGAENHWPFIYYNYLNEPDVFNITGSNEFETNMKRSAWLQDKYLGYGVNLFLNDSNLKEATYMIISDNPWPIGKHKNNTFNIANAYEENLMTSSVIINGDFTLGTSEKNHLSNLHFFNTVLSLGGFDVSSDNTSCLLSVQPFTQKKIVIKYFPYKYIVDVNSEKIDMYNIENDTNELNPLPTDTSFKELLDKCEIYFK